MSPYISIIIPTYNRCFALNRLLESLCLQTFKDFEVVITDDGSTDSTYSVVHSYSQHLDIIYTPITNSGGPARPRNVSLELSSGTFISFLDSDDWWFPHRLDSVVSNISKTTDVLYHDLRYFDTSSNHFLSTLSSTRVPTSLPIFQQLLCSGMTIPLSSLVIRSTIIDQVGGFSELPILHSVEDLDLLIRISLVTDNFHRIPGILGAYTCNGPTNISSVYPFQPERLEYLYYSYLPLLPPTVVTRAINFLHYRLSVLETRQYNLTQAAYHLSRCNPFNLSLRYMIRYFFRWISLSLRGFNPLA